MEYTNINVETNKQWEHARSAEQLVQKKARLAELQYIRDLFNDRLPVGEELTEIQSYFDHLEQVINSHGQLENERFPPEANITDPESGGRIPYRYYSPALSQQRAIEGGGDAGDSTDQSDHRLITDASDVASAGSSGRCDDVQDSSQEPSHLSHMAKRKSRLDSVYEELGIDGCDDDHDSERQLGCCRPG